MATPVPARPVGTSDSKELLMTVLLSTFVVALLACGTTWFYLRSQAILTEEVRGQLKTFGALAAMQFSAADIQAIRGPGDTQKPVFRLLVERAERIRQHAADAAFVYVMRRTENPDELAFVIENDMLLTPAAQDTDGNGTVDEDEAVPLPGETYDIEDIPALQQDAFEGPTADAEVSRDQWGRWISGYAPIRDASGETVAILGIDMHADRFFASTGRIFSLPLFMLALLALLLISGGFAVFLWRRRLRLLERLDVQRRAMVTVASHKLGGPIATLRWWIESLDGGVLQRTDDLTEAKKELSCAIERLSGVMRHLDDVTKMESSDPRLWERLAAETGEEIV